MIRALFHRSRNGVRSDCNEKHCAAALTAMCEARFAQKRNWCVRINDHSEGPTSRIPNVDATSNPNIAVAIAIVAAVFQSLARNLGIVLEPPQTTFHPSSYFLRFGALRVPANIITARPTTTANVAITTEDEAFKDAHIILLRLITVSVKMVTMVRVVSSDDLRCRPKQSLLLRKSFLSGSRSEKRIGRRSYGN